MTTSKELGMNDSIMRICQNRKNWLGSYYELGIMFDATEFDVQKRLDLLRTLWQAQPLLGIVEDRNMFGQPWQSIDITFRNKKCYSCYGCIRLKNGRMVGCGSTLVESENVLWLALYIPLGMLDLVYTVDYSQPITHEGNSWTMKVDEVLAPIGMRLYRDFRFELGVLGEEASGVPIEKVMARLAHHPGLLVPESLFKRKGETPYGLRTPDGLWWTGGTKNDKHPKNEPAAL